MKTKLFILGIIPLLFSVSSCNGNNEIDPDVYAKLMEEVTYQDEIITQGKADFKYDELLAFYDEIHYLINSNLKDVYTHKYEHNQYYLNYYTEVEQNIKLNLYKDYDYHFNKLTSGKTKDGSIVVTDSEEENVYGGVIKEQKAIYEYSTNGKEEYDHLTRSYFVDSDYYEGNEDDIIQQDKFYESILGDNYFEIFTDEIDLELDDYDVYNYGENYLFYFENNSYSDVSENITFYFYNQVIMVIDKVGHIKELTSYMASEKLDKEGNKDQGDYYTYYSRQLFVYGDKQKSDGTGFNLAEAVAKKGVIETVSFETTNTDLNFRYGVKTTIKNPRYIDTAISLFISEGNEDQTYKVPYQIKVQYFTSLNEKSKEAKVDIDFSLSTLASDYISSISPDEFDLLFKLNIDDVQYKFMNFYFFIKLTLDENMQFVSNNSFISLSFAYTGLK